MSSDERSLVMRTVSALLAVLLSAVMAYANVTVTGEGKVSAVPDIAYLSVGVVSDGDTASAAMDANSAAMRNLFKLLKTVGIEDKDVKTASFSFGPKYRQLAGHEPELVGYTASHEVTVTVQRVDETGRVLDALVKDGANRVNGVSFGVKDTEKLLDEARKKAV